MDKGNPPLPPTSGNFWFWYIVYEVKILVLSFFLNFSASPIEKLIKMMMRKFVTWWVEIVEDNMKDDDELTAGDRKRRSCYFCFWDRNWCTSKVLLCCIWRRTFNCVRQAEVFIGFGLGVYLSSHKYPFNIQNKKKLK